MKNIFARNQIKTTNKKQKGKRNERKNIKKKRKRRKNQSSFFTHSFIKITFQIEINSPFQSRSKYF